MAAVSGESLRLGAETSTEVDGLGNDEKEVVDGQNRVVAEYWQRAVLILRAAFSSWR